MLHTKTISSEQINLLTDISSSIVSHIEKNSMHRISSDHKIFMRSGFQKINYGFEYTNAEKRIFYIDAHPSLGQIESDRERLKELFYAQMKDIPLKEGTFGRVTLFTTILDRKLTLGICDIQPSRGYRHLYAADKKQGNSFYNHYPWVHYLLDYLESLVNREQLNPWDIQLIVAPTKNTIEKRNNAPIKRHGHILEGDRKRYYHRPFKQLRWEKEIYDYHYLDDQESHMTELWLPPTRLYRPETFLNNLDSYWI